MRKLIIMEHISLDGIIQHSADDDDQANNEASAFPYPDWTVPYRTLAGRDALLAAYGTHYDLLLGRRTYDLWSGVWPNAPSNPMADSINAATKYIVTHRPETLAWGPFEGVGPDLLEGVGPDLLEGVRRIKAQDGPDLILWGSSTLTSTLLAHGLVDELLLIVYPILLGTGKRFFAQGTPAHTFELLSTQTTPTGVVLSKYKVVGPLKTT